MSPSLNILAPDVAANPYPFYEELRRGPVGQVQPGGMWAVSRHDDVLAVLKDPQRFSSAAWADRRKPAWLERDAFGPANLMTVDPPVHTQQRNLVSRAFGPAAMARLEPKIRAMADDLAEEVVRRGEVDFVADFALPLPAQVICHILGLDFSLHRVFKQWADDMVLMIGGMPTPEQIDRIRTSLADMERYFTEVVEARRRAPREDVVTDLALAEMDGQALSHGEILGFLRLLMLAGLETTISLLGNAMHVLSMHPAEKERVLADRALIPQTLEEVLRYEPSVHCLFRRSVVEAEVGGTVVPKGALLLVILASALRDEQHIPQADRFLIDRQRTSSLPFGTGIHFCLGAALARMEARLALEALFSRIRGFSRTDSKLSWSFSPNVRGLKSLPLRLEPVQAG